MPRDYPFLKRGYATLEEVQDHLPPIERTKKGPVATNECIEEIPCNSCAMICPTKAVEMPNINAMPKVHFDKCIGCTLCLQVCPGLAFFMLDKSKSPEGKTWVTVPHELLPIPKVGDIVKALDRTGKHVTDAKVVRVIKSPKAYGTYLITVEVDDKYAYHVRAILA